MCVPLREGGKLDPFKQIPYPPPYVPRYLTFEITERIDSEGDIFIPLDEGSVRGKQAAEKRGNEIITLSDAEAALWREKTRPVVDNWLKAKQEQGVDGAALLAKAEALIAKYQKA